jgi:hypothetical protein
MCWILRNLVQRPPGFRFRSCNLAPAGIHRLLPLQIWDPVEIRATTHTAYPEQIADWLTEHMCSRHCWNELCSKKNAAQKPKAQTVANITGNRVQYLYLWAAQRFICRLYSTQADLPLSSEGSTGPCMRACAATMQLGFFGPTTASTDDPNASTSAHGCNEVHCPGPGWSCGCKIYLRVGKFMPTFHGPRGQPTSRMIKHQSL